ncbi:hypothetical protein C8J57DRAFT_1395271 [Mycena rebaudengoi]|nr:hypothetical protein C8J57DRAFT_1395271 [Mycena rebaudengoi]
MGAESEFSEGEALSFMRLQAVKVRSVTASTMLLFFDYCLTLDLEISLIWPSRWSLTKILYLLTRYPRIFRRAAGHCAQLNTGITAGNVFGLMIAEAILVLRTYALSGRNRNVFMVFGTTYLVCVAATVSMVGIFLRHMIYSPPPLNIPGCNLTGGPFKLVGISYMLVLANETALMGYTLWLGIRTYRHSQNTLVRTLIHDGIAYYICLFLGTTTNVALLVAGPVRLLRVVHSILSARVLLHVREVERRELEVSEHLGATPTEVQFAVSEDIR